MKVKMLSRRIELAFTEPEQEILVERPWISNGANAELLICKRNGQAFHSGGAGEQSPPIRVTGAGALELISPPPRGIDPREVRAPRLKFFSVTRRILSETRDRVTPIGALLRGKRQGISSH